MDAVVIRVGSVLHTGADKVECLELLTSGKIEIISPDFHFTAERGTILGLFEFPGETYNYTYIAKEDCTVERYPFRRKSDADPIVRDRADECDVLVSANAALALSFLGHYKRSLRRTETLRRAITKAYNDYRRLCSENGFVIQPWPLAEEQERFIPETELPDWLGDYYDQLGLMPTDIKRSYYSTHTSLTTAAIMEAADHTGLIMRLSEALDSYNSNLREDYRSSVNLFDLYLNLRMHCDATPEVCAQIDEAVGEYDTQVSSMGLMSDEELSGRRAKYMTAAAANQSIPLPQEAEDIPPAKDSGLSQGITPAKDNAFDPYKRIRGSINIILEFAGISGEEAAHFEELIKQYRALKEKNSTDKEVKKLKSEISAAFYRIYESAFLAAVKMKHKPPEIVRLFLYFGYMDEELMGVDNTLQLLKLADRLDSDGHKDLNVYTAYEWLKLIYDGEREPSINEFEQDYPAYLKSLRQAGDIDDTIEEYMLFSPEERLHFEIDNFFKGAMGIAGGRSSSFCPVLSAHSFVRPPEQSFITGRNVDKNWASILETDYSLFYRECLYQNESYKISKELILKEVKPEMIMLPQVGKLGGMWQEISGISKDTPARMFLPIFSDEDLNLIQLRLAGEFRWAICRRVQGVRWNNISVPSLTSHYYDYLQFYKKNKEISSAAKEKLRSQIHSCRNSYENVFVLDYIQWIRFESKGIPRLNRAARQILSTFCPFSAAVRDKLGANPLYSSLIRHHESTANEKRRLLENKYSKFKDPEGNLPGIITAFINYYRL